MALSLCSIPRLRKSEDSPDRYQVTHPSPAQFVSPHPVEKERAQTSIHVEDDNSFSVAHQTRAVARLPYLFASTLLGYFLPKRVDDNLETGDA